MVSGGTDCMVKDQPAPAFKCYRVSEHPRRTGALIAEVWFVIEDTSCSRYRSVGFSGRLQVRRDIPSVTLIETVQDLDDAFNGYLRLNQQTPSTFEQWNDLAADSIDKAIDEHKSRQSARELSRNTRHSKPQDELWNPQGVDGRVSDLRVRHSKSLRQEQDLEQIIDKQKAELLTMTGAKCVYWKHVEPTPAGRICEVLVIER